MKIHSNNPPGHILVFVSCQQEVNDLTRILKENYKKNTNKRRKNLDGSVDKVEIVNV